MAWIFLAGIVGHGAPVPVAAIHGPAASAAEPFQAFPVANLNRTFDVSALPEVEAPVAVAHGLVFTWSRELWVTDGTADGTRRLCGPDPDLCVDVRSRLASPPGLLYFVDDRLREEDRALWRTDGTEEGTFPVTDPLRTRLETILHIEGHAHPLAGRVFFVAEDREAGTGLEPWITDGTPAGTRQVRDIATGPVDTSSAPVFGATLGPRVVFAASDGDGDREPWITDGTPEGTRKLVDLARGDSSFPLGFATLGDHVLVWANQADVGPSLWRSDGFLTADLVARFPFGAGTIGNSVFLALANRVLFVAGNQLWASDGTVAGTRLLFQPGEHEVLLPEVHVAGQRAIFAARSFADGLRIWSTDGTPQGTRMLADPCPGSCEDLPTDFHPIGDQTVFSVEDRATGREPWISDGTSPGTRRLVDLCPGPCSSRPKVVGSSGALLAVSADGGSYPRSFTRRGNELFFTAQTPEPGLWATDGTPGGTRRVWTVPEGAEIKDPLVGLGSSGPVFFVTHEGDLGPVDLYRTDGTAEGTIRLADDLDRGIGSGLKAQLLGAGDRVFYLAAGSPRPWPEAGLWVSDGTVEGTRRILRLPVSFFPGAKVLNGKLVFSASEATTGMDRLWVSDGTESGTHPLLDVDRRPILNPGILTVAGSSLFFFTYDPGPGVSRNLWISDGSSSGTHRISPSAGMLSTPTAVKAVGTALFFTTTPTPLGRYILWRSDGTPQGTQPLATSVGLLTAYGLQRVGERLIFFGRAAQPTHTEADSFALWITDGTPAGTHRLAAVRSQIQAVEHGRSLFFIEQDPPPIIPYYSLPPASPARLWRSDGSAEGTVALTLPLPETAPASLETLAGHLLLVTLNEERGSDLWLLDDDGALATRIGRFSSILGGLVQVAGHVVFPASRPEIGAEPWVFELPAGPLARRLGVP